MKKRRSVKPGEWIDIPQREWKDWFSEWVVSSMVLRAWGRDEKSPKQIMVPDPCIKKNKDGSATLKFDVRY